VAAHERIRAALSSSDKCAVRQVNGDLFLYGDEGEQDAAEMARLDCESIRNREEEARRRDEKCRRLAATSEVRLEDLLLDREQLGCGDATWNRIVGRLAASPDLWQQAFTLSGSMKSSLLDVGLSDNAKAALKAHAESFAANAVRTGKLGDLSDAELLCHLAADFHAAAGSSCSAVPSKLKIAKVNAAAVDKAQTAAAAAKQARCQALEDARNKCFSDRCLSLDVDDPRNDQCEARCERQFPMPGCND
jgi:urease accessory protein UreF